jgi:integrase
MPVRRRPEGGWIIDFRTADGRRIRKTKSGITKRQAEALERELRSQNFFPEAKQCRNTTWGNIAARFWLEHGQHLSWARTVKQHLEMISDAIGDTTPIQDITTDKVASAIAHWRERPIYNSYREYIVIDSKTGLPKLPSPATINRRIAVLKSVWNMASQTWEFPVPTIAWKRLRLRERQTIERYLSPEEQSRLLDACPSYLKDIVEFALATGLRRSALMSLRWEYVHWNREEILAVGKGDRANPIPITSRVTTILRRVGVKDKGLIFLRDGKPIKSFDKAWELTKRRVGLEDVRFHDLRHTFAQMLMDSIGDLSTVQDALHHSTPTVTRRYAHRRISQIAAAIERAQQ